MTRRGEAGFLNNSCRNRIPRPISRSARFYFLSNASVVRSTERNGPFGGNLVLILAGRRAAATQCYRYSRWHAVQGVCH